MFESCSKSKKRFYACAPEQASTRENVGIQRSENLQFNSIMQDRHFSVWLGLHSFFRYLDDEKENDDNDGVDDDDGNGDVESYTTTTTRDRT